MDATSSAVRAKSEISMFSLIRFGSTPLFSVRVGVVVVLISWILNKEDAAADGDEAHG
jgi:hypothetical protein